MNFADLVVGKKFTYCGRVFVVVDRGTSVVIAVGWTLERETQGWLNGPPCPVNYEVFDETTFPYCNHHVNFQALP